MGVTLLEAPFIGTRRQRPDSIPELRHVGSVRELGAVIRLAVGALLRRVGGVIDGVLVAVTHAIFAELASEQRYHHADADEEDDTYEEDAGGHHDVLCTTVVTWCESGFSGGCDRDACRVEEM